MVYALFFVIGLAVGVLVAAVAAYVYDPLGYGLYDDYLLDMFSGEDDV